MALRFLHEVERLVHEHVKQNHPRDWDEDFITRSLLKGIRDRLQNIAVSGLRQGITVSWEAWKQVGTPERFFGDIAVWVRIRDRYGDRLEGVGFLEAKRRSANGRSFEALKFEQLRRIVRRAPRSAILLYDYQDVTEFRYATGLSVPWPLLSIETPVSWWSIPAVTQAVTFPCSHILYLRKRDVSLYTKSMPFSHQLLWRYLQGYDLEFSEDAKRIVTGGSNAGAPKYILTASVPIKQMALGPAPSPYYYTKIHGAPPAEADLQRYFRVSPPAVHQMILTLAARGLIERVPGQARSIRLRVSRAVLPDLE